MLIFVLVLALAVYLTTRLLQQRGVATPTGQLRARPRTRQPEPRVQGPDDDDDFLREIDRRRRQAKEPDA